MDWIVDYLAPIGLVIICLTMLRLMVRRMQKAAENERQRKADIQAAQAAERKRQRETIAPRSKVSSPSTRAPLVDPFGTAFVGSVRGVAAKWEMEMHQLGRQVIGQIDCKMAALQAITQDANRTANRLEMLVEHLEQIAKQQIDLNALAESADTPSNVIPAALAPDAAPLAVALKELTDDLNGMRNAIKQNSALHESPEPVAILRPVAGDYVHESSSNLRNEVEMLSNYGLDPQEIARRLDISLGEVDLMLQVQQNRLDRTM